MKTSFAVLSACLLFCIAAFAAVPSELSTVEVTTLVQLRAVKIVIPKVNFRQTTLLAAFEYLYLKSRQLDPEGFGVTMILAPSESDLAAARQPLPPIAGVPIADEAQQPVHNPIIITLQLEKVSIA